MDYHQPDCQSDEEIDITNLTIEDVKRMMESNEPQLELKYISDDPPDYDSWTLPLLVGYDIRGRLHEWQIWFVEPFMYIRHGLRDGKKQIDRREVKINQSGRTIYEQAWLEICQRYKKMTMQKGYRMEGEADSNLFKVMRAQIYNKESKLEFPAFYDYKMDGYRHYIMYNNGSIQGYSREGSLRSHMTHLDSDLIQLFEFLPPGTILDAELYRHGMVFEDISSAIRTQLQVHERLAELQVHIFDACWDRSTPFEQRRQRLELAIEKYYSQAGIPFKKSGIPDTVKSRDSLGNRMDVTIGVNFLVKPSTAIRLSHGFLAYERDELDEAMKKSVRPLLEDYSPHSGANLRRGYEGIMIKRLSNGSVVESQSYKMSTYFYGKCAHIYKHKMFHDMEGLCVGVENATGREEGCAILKMLLTSGARFNLRMSGSQERRRQWFANPDSIIGQLITFRYQRLSNAGVPIFPVGLHVREDLSLQPYLEMMEAGEIDLTPEEIRIIRQACNR